MLTRTHIRPIRSLALMVATAWLTFGVAVVPAGATSIFDFFAQGDRDRGRVVRSGDKVRIGSGVSVDEDEVVMGDLVSVLGSARVNGQVTGEVVVVLGNLFLGPNSRVDDVTVVAGEVRRSPGARVTGDFTEVGFGRLGRDLFDWGDVPRFRLGFPEGAGIAWTVFRLLFLATLVAAVVFVAPATVRRVAGHAGAAPLKAGLLGFGIQILFVPVLVVVTVLLAISIIGIPFLLLIPFVILGLFVALVIGFSGVAFEVGRWIRSRGGTDAGNMFGMALLGVVAVVAFALVGRGVALGGGLFSLFAAIVLACAFLIEYAVWTVGMGAVALAGFSGKRYSARPLPPGPSAPMGGGAPPAPTTPSAPAGPAGGPATDPSTPATPLAMGTQDAVLPSALLGAAAAQPASDVSPVAPVDFDPELRIADGPHPDEGDPPDRSS